MQVFKPKLCVAQRFNYPVEFDLSNSTGLKNSLKTAQKTNVEPDMATYWYNSMLCKFLNPNYAWHNELSTWSNLTGLKNSLKTAQKTNVEPDMATYWYNSMLCKFLNPNYVWHNEFDQPQKQFKYGTKNKC